MVTVLVDGSEEGSTGPVGCKPWYVVDATSCSLRGRSLLPRLRLCSVKAEVVPALVNHYTINKLTQFNKTCSYNGMELYLLFTVWENMPAFSFINLIIRELRCSFYYDLIVIFINILTYTFKGRSFVKLLLVKHCFVIVTSPFPINSLCY